MGTVKTDTFIDRLKTAMAHAGLPLNTETIRPALWRFLQRHYRDQGEPCPIKTRQTIYNWFDGKQPSTEHYVMLSDALNCNLKWLITGRQSIIKGVRPTPDEAELLGINAALEAHHEQRDAWIRMGREAVKMFNPRAALTIRRR